MPRYRVTRTQTIFRVYEFEADSLEQARAKASAPARVVSERIMPEVADPNSVVEVSKRTKRR